MRERVPSQVVMQKIIPNINPLLSENWKVPEGDRAMGVISCDHEETMLLALDDASKKADITVLYAQTVYEGRHYSWSRYGGEITAIITGKNVSDVSSGIRYIDDYIRRGDDLFLISGENCTMYYAQVTPHAGPFFRDRYGIAQGSAYAYLLGDPIASMYALDHALNASQTHIAKLQRPQTRDNKAGAIVVGTEAACKTAADVFSKVVEQIARRPLMYQ
ncbi:MAG: BMC domain-containing protein [Lachnospiraceae bacterium]|nr:BMC domain-containing protein [Lachnospiraceae bacterium]